MKREIKGALIGGGIGFILPLIFLSIRFSIITKKIGVVCGTIGGTSFCSSLGDIIIQDLLPIPYTLGFIFWIGAIIGAVIGYFLMRFKNEK